MIVVTSEQYDAYHEGQHGHSEPTDHAHRDFTADDIAVALAALGPDDD